MRNVSNFFGYSYGLNETDSDSDDHVNLSAFLIVPCFCLLLFKWLIRFSTADGIFLEIMSVKLNAKFTISIYW